MSSERRRQESCGACSLSSRNSRLSVANEAPSSRQARGAGPARGQQTRSQRRSARSLAIRQRASEPVAKSQGEAVRFRRIAQTTRTPFRRTAAPLAARPRSGRQRATRRAGRAPPTTHHLCNRWGRRLDPSALRRRYKSGCAAAGLRPVRLHGLRHAAGSLIARTADPVFVRDFLGHAKLATTDRYLSAKLRPEELERLDAAFAVARLEPMAPS
jgi:integrase